MKIECSNQSVVTLYATTDGKSEICDLSWSLTRYMACKDISYSEG
jgi:hypothetical protein